MYDSNTTELRPEWNRIARCDSIDVCMYVERMFLWENLLCDWLSLSPWSQLKAEMGPPMGFRPVSDPQKGQVWNVGM